MTEDKADFGGRDISFETLAQVCSIDIAQLTKSSRGELNAALKQLRDATPELADLELALVIEDKANAYRQVMDGALLTPSALAKHWAALEGMRAEQKVSYPVYEPIECARCDGLRFVEADDGFVQGYAPCPDCNPKGLEIAREYRARMERMYGHRPKAPSEEELGALGKAVGARPKPGPSPLIP